MSEVYDATYAAVRSKMSYSDIAEVFRQEIHNMNISHHIECAAQEICAENTRPFILIKPKVFKDGNEWCCLYGDDLVSGVSAFGKSADLASRNFDTEWFKEGKAI